jgi:hypothetical protein
MAAILTGTSCIYGIGTGTVANLFVQSYSVSAGFNNEDTVQNEAGITVTHRLDDRKTTLSIDGICKTDAIPALGATLSFTTNTKSVYPLSSGTASNSFTGIVTKVDEKSVNKGFCSVSIEAVDYEGISYA